MSFNIGNFVSTTTTILEVALEAETDLQLDITAIKAGQPATTPPVGGSIEGVAGKFTVTFTPNA